MSTNEGFGRHILLLGFNVTITKAKLISCLIKQMILIINMTSFLKISDNQAPPGKIFFKEEVTRSLLFAETNPNKII